MKTVTLEDFDYKTKDILLCFDTDVNRPTKTLVFSFNHLTGKGIYIVSKRNLKCLETKILQNAIDKYNSI